MQDSLLDSAMMHGVSSAMSDLLILHRQRPSKIGNHSIERTSRRSVGEPERSLGNLVLDYSIGLVCIVSS